MLVVIGEGGGALEGGLGFWRGGRAAGTYNCVMFVGRSGRLSVGMCVCRSLAAAGRLSSFCLSARMSV